MSGSVEGAPSFGPDSEKYLNVFPGGLVMRFVVIGGDAAGMSAASRAKRNKADLDVTVLEQTKDVSYSA